MKQVTTSTSCLSPFNGKTIVFELGREIGFKAKQELIKYLREQQAHISYILTASTDYVLTTNNVDSYKIRRAKQLGLPLINVEYVYAYRCLAPGQTSIDIDKFIIKSVEDQENFTKTGTISIAGSRANVTKINKFDLTKIKLWNSDDADLPRFDELTHCEIGKWAIFKETNDNSDVFFVLELQVIPEQYYDRTTSDYRLRFRYEKQTIVVEGQQQPKKVLIQYAFSDDPNEQQQLFASYYYRVATMPRVTRIREMLPDKLGSKLLLRSLFTHRIDTQMLDDNVCQLIESIWIESIGDLNNILSILPESINLKTIIEAEAALLEVKLTNDPAAALRFYSLIPHRPQYNVDLIKNRRALTEKIDLCQMLRDMVTVNELTNWNVKAPIEAKYRALKCHIETLSSSTPEFKNIAQLIQSSTDSGEQILIHNVFSVAKQTDALNFCTTLSHQCQLFHGSKYTNFIGILSRGLAMPKIVVEELGVVRTDIGCLGYGIYFSDSASTSLKYTTASTTRPGRRLLCICQVALGESANYYSFSPTLIKPPDGFHSTHGVKRTEDNNSMFTDNEYAIYQLDQQRLIYIVEVSWAPHDALNIELERLPIVHHQQHLLKLSEHVEVPMTMDDEVIEIAEQDYGLICPSSGKLVPLKSFHIRAQIVDATVEVVLYQVYHNTSSTPIEAKYVFPLDENSTVCGFEAHINNKVIKGVVKEKEQAKKEYREAIEKGHGAYLMHQEQAQVFSVAVGNLPSNNEVIIKITYVAELEIENDDIIFRLPAKMSSWQSKQAIESKDQSIVRSIGIIDEKVEFSLKASIRMPYQITKLFSPTHRLRRKLTECMAMVELVDNVLIDRDFVLSITLNSANLPRISNETLLLDDNSRTTTSNNNDSQACMLTFYPRFEILTNSNEQVEIIFIVDVSNSMDGTYVQQAKQLAHLFLTNLKVNDGNTYFNIVTFGSDNDECFPISMPTTKENLDKAKHFVLHSLVHRGNTDLFAVFHRYSLLPSSLSSKFGRQFILLSDGHIHDLNSILVLLEHRSAMRRDRLFTCSIGDIANKHALKQLANGANGGGLTTIFDSNYRSKWKTKVLSILEHIRQPCVTSISIDWHGHFDQQQKFNMQAPKMIRSLFNGMRISVYRFIRNCHKATLTATIDGQEFVTTVFSSMMTTTEGRILHCLTARAIIEDYDNGMLHVDESENELIKAQYKQDLIDLSIKHSVISAYTSFVAIEERDDKTDKQIFPTGVRLLDVMLDRDGDLLPYIGWDGDVSNLNSIKQKLIDARILLESASIQNKKESINDIEKLCENISYRVGGDSKFDMMMSIIRTYRYSFNQHDKADQLEHKMRNDVKKEMINATTEERQALQQRCQINNLIITNYEAEQFFDDDMEQDVLETHSSQLKLKSEESENACNDLDLSFLDTMDESSYLEFTKIVSELQSKTNDLKQESLKEYEETDSCGVKDFDDDSTSLRFTDTRGPSSTSQNLLTSKIIQEAKQILMFPDDNKSEEKKKSKAKGSVSATPLGSSLELSEQQPKSVAKMKMKPIRKSTSGLTSSYKKSSVQISEPVASSYCVDGSAAKNSSHAPVVFPSVKKLVSLINEDSDDDDIFNIPKKPPQTSTTVTQKIASSTKHDDDEDENLFSEPTTKSTVSSKETPKVILDVISDNEADLFLLKPCEVELPILINLPSAPTTKIDIYKDALGIEKPVETIHSIKTSSVLIKKNLSYDDSDGDITLERQLYIAALTDGEKPNVKTLSSFLKITPGAHKTATHPKAASIREESPKHSTDEMFDRSKESQISTGTELPTPSDPYEHIADNFEQASLSLSEPSSSKISYPTISLSKTATSLASRSGGSCTQSSIPSQPKPKIQISSSVSSLRDKHRSIRVLTTELPSSNDDTLNTTVAMNSTSFSTDQSVRYDDDIRKFTTESVKSKSMIRKKTRQVEISQSKTKDVSTFDTSVCDLLLLDVCPLGLGIEDIYGHMHTLIRRNTTIPTRTQLFPVFTNAHAYQMTATIRIFEGEHYLTKYNNFLGEFSLSGLTSNFAAQKLEIAIRMEIDANGILRLDAEEALSGAKASFIFVPTQQRLSKDDIEQHITYVNSDANFLAKSVYDRKPNDPLYLLDGQTEAVIRNFSGEHVTSFGQTTVGPLLSKLKYIRSTTTMIEELIKLQSEDGSFTLNKDLADVFHINIDTFNGLEHYLREQGFNSLALNIRNEILHLIGTGVILIWLVFQTQALQQNTFQFLFNIEQIKVHLCNNLSANMNEQINKAIEFYQRTSQRNGIYCRQLELTDSSWDMFIQRIIIGIDRDNN